MLLTYYSIIPALDIIKNPTIHSTSQLSYPRGSNALSLDTVSPFGGRVSAEADQDQISFPTVEELVGAADTYFHYCYNQPYTLFHEEIFRKRLLSGSVSRCLLFAFLATAHRFSDPNGLTENGAATVRAYATRAWRELDLSRLWSLGYEEVFGAIQAIILLSVVDFTGTRTVWVE